MEELQSQALALFTEGRTIKEVSSMVPLPEADLQRILSLVPSRKRDGTLADRLNTVVDRLVDNLSTRTDLDDAPISQVSSSIAVLIDKMRLLREQSTQNISLANYVHFLQSEDPE